MEDLKFPIGKFNHDDDFNFEKIQAAINDLSALPKLLNDCVSNLDAEKLNTPYRDGGWKVYQVINHIADSHLNAFVRLKLAMTEDKPTIKPYSQNLWNETADADIEISSSIKLIEGLHERMVKLIKSMSENDYNKELIHPERGVVTIKWIICLYGWHGKHHIAQIESLKKRMNWL